MTTDTTRTVRIVAGDPTCDSREFDRRNRVWRCGRPGTWAVVLSAYPARLGAAVACDYPSHLEDLEVLLRDVPDTGGYEIVRLERGA